MRAAFLPSLALVLSGCYGVGWSQTDVPPPATPIATRSFEQYCTFYGSSDIHEVNAFLHRQATLGWRLVGVTGQRGTIYCFVGETAPAAERTDTPAAPPATPEAHL